MSDVIMDEETRRKLMGYSIITQSIKYTVEVDGVDEMFHPVFDLVTSSNKDSKVIKNMTMDSFTNEKFSNKQIEKRMDTLDKVTQKSIVGFSRFYDTSLDVPKLMDFIPQKNCSYISDEQYDLLPQGVKALIMNEILKMNGLA